MTLTRRALTLLRVHHSVAAASAKSASADASGSPAVGADGVYLLWTSGAKLIAMSLDHGGERRWQRELGAFYSNHGSAVSPVLCEDLLVIANENQGDDCFLTAAAVQRGEEAVEGPRADGPGRRAGRTNDGQRTRDQGG